MSWLVGRLVGWFTVFAASERSTEHTHARTDERRLTAMSRRDARVTETGILGALQYLRAHGMDETDAALFIDKDLDPGRVRSIVNSFNKSKRVMLDELEDSHVCLVCGAVFKYVLVWLIASFRRLQTHPSSCNSLTRTAGADAACSIQTCACSSARSFGTRVACMHAHARRYYNDKARYAQLIPANVAGRLMALPPSLLDGDLIQSINQELANVPDVSEMWSLCSILGDCRQSTKVLASYFGPAFIGQPQANQTNVGAVKKFAAQRTRVLTFMMVRCRCWLCSIVILRVATHVRRI